jgi:ribosome-binding protein aMBF1 (putative translation factor)
MFIRTLLTTDSRVVKIPFGMAKGHTYFWRRPGRRDEERKQFAVLMRKVEGIRVREGLSKSALAAEIGTNENALRNWMTGRALGRRETIPKLELFVKSRETA